MKKYWNLNYRLNLLLVCFIALIISGCMSNEVKTNQSNLNEILLNEAELAYRENQYNIALEKYILYNEYDDKNPSVWQRIATLQAKLKDYHSSIQSYEKALTLNPNLPLAWHNLSILHIEKTKKTLEAFLHFTPKDHPLYQKAQMLNDKMEKLYGEN